jgi:hypothetical protein
MQLNNVFIVAPQEEQKEIELTSYDFEGCTGIHINRYEFVSNEKNLKKWVKFITSAKVVVTVGNWSTNQETSDLVRIARILGIEVIHEANYKKYVEQKNN